MTQVLAQATRLDRALGVLENNFARIKGLCDQYAGKWADGGNADEVEDLLGELRKNKAAIEALAGTSGLVAWARDVYNDQSYNVGAGATDTLALVDAAITTLEGLTPVDANGWLLRQKRGVDGTLQPRTANGAAFAPAITALQAVSANIVT